MTNWNTDATQQYAREQSQQWRQPLTANLRSLGADAGRLSHADAIVVSPRGVGARVGDTTPEQKFRELKQGHQDSRSDGRWSAAEFKATLDRVKAEHDARKAGKPTGDRADGYRRDAFSMQDADCWEQGQWVFAHSDGQLLHWKRKDAPQEVLQRLQD